MLITIGKYNKKTAVIFPAGPTTKPKQLDDIVLLDGVIWRLVWNHNGLRLRGQDVTDQARPEMLAAGWRHARLLDNDGNETGRKWVHDSNARDACGFMWFASNGRLTLGI